MHELLQGLGWTDMAINIVEILFYVILILSGLLALSKQLIKAVRKLIPKVRQAKSNSLKLKIIRAFCKWVKEALKDGVISDEEIVQINKELSTIMSNHNDENNAKPNEELKEADADFKQVDNVNGVKFI